MSTLMLTALKTPNGQPGRPDSWPLKGLSGVKGNFHAPFLWGWVVETPPGYQAGYGFLIPDEGGREVFIHEKILHAAGYKALHPSTRVFAKVLDSERGPEARTIRIIYDNQQKEAG